MHEIIFSPLNDYFSLHKNIYLNDLYLDMYICEHICRYNTPFVQVFLKLFGFKKGYMKMVENFYYETN